MSSARSPLTTEDPVILNIQRWLAEHGPDYAKLAADKGVNATPHPTDPLTLFVYDQIDANKRDPLVQECRGLVLEQDTWNVVSRPFFRFFNAGEVPEIEKGFDWENCAAESKEDGSLIQLYWYGDSWRVNTRGSWGGGGIQGHDITWRELFLKTVKEGVFDELNRGLTYLFELTSRYNQVVRVYPTPASYLLSTFHTRTGVELNEFALDVVADKLGCPRPSRHRFASLDEVEDHLAAHPEATFEGFVLRDRNGLRLKVKSPRYVALHRLYDNGNLAKARNIIPLVFANEQDEVLTYFPELAPRVFALTETIAGLKARTESVWEWARREPTQKDFALRVKDEKLSGILFEARKRNDFASAWKERAEGSLQKLLGDSA